MAKLGLMVILAAAVFATSCGRGGKSLFSTPADAPPPVEQKQQ